MLPSEASLRALTDPAAAPCPRPISTVTPANGLIGCFSKDDKSLLAIAWSSTQELFQGVITCIHSDFRIGGLRPGETKRLTGRIYLMENDVRKLLRLYHRDFPPKAASDRHEAH